MIDYIYITKQSLRLTHKTTKFMRENFISLSRCCSCLFTLILRGCLASLSAENSKIKLDQGTFLVAQKNLPHFPTLYFGTFFGGEIFGKIFCLRYQLSFFSRFERQFQKDIQSWEATIIYSSLHIHVHSFLFFPFPFLVHFRYMYAYWHFRYFLYNYIWMDVFIVFIMIIRSVASLWTGLSVGLLLFHKGRCKSLHLSEQLLHCILYYQLFHIYFRSFGSQLAPHFSTSLPSLLR